MLWSEARPWPDAKSKRFVVRVKEVAQNGNTQNGNTTLRYVVNDASVWLKVISKRITNSKLEPVAKN